MTASIWCLVFVSIVCSVYAGKLYGLSPVDGVHLVTIDPATGKTTPVGPKLGEVISSQLSSIDDKRKIYYFVSFNQLLQRINLIGVNLDDGKVKYDIPLPFGAAEILGVDETCNVDPITGDVFVSGKKRGSDTHDVYRVTPSTGKLDYITGIGFGDVLGGVNAYDPLRKTLWMELANNHTLQLFSLDITSGKWTNVNIPNPLNLETMSYDNVTGLFYGIGLREIGQNWTRILMTFDGRTLDFETIADIPGYLMIDANMAGIDLTGRRLFCVLEPTKKNEVPYQLVTVDIKTGKVLSNPEIPNTDLFPWSIEYYNGK